MAITIPADELSSGDYIKTPDGVRCLVRVPIDKSATFVAWYAHPTERREASVEFEPSEVVEVLARWPEAPWT